MISIEWAVVVFMIGTIAGIIIGVKIDRPAVHKIGKQKVKGKGKGIFKNRQDGNSTSS